jgi:hypothetical protein
VIRRLGLLLVAGLLAACAGLGVPRGDRAPIDHVVVLFLVDRFGLAPLTVRDRDAAAAAPDRAAVAAILPS